MFVQIVICRSSKTYGIFNKFFSKNFEVRGIFGGQGEIKILQDQNTEVISELQSKINIKKDWRSFLKLKEAINKFKPDIVHVHSFKASLLIRCICMFSL